jgi:hypothetical protein
MFVYTGSTVGRSLPPLGGESGPAIAFIPMSCL